MSYDERVRRALRKASHAQAHKRSFLWQGPKGTCECCDQLVDVYLCSPLGQPVDRPWTASEKLLTGLFEPLLRRMQEKDGKFYVRCSGAMLADKRHAKTQAKLYYFDLDGQLAGPFCLACLKDFMRKWQQGDGGTPNLRVYKVTCSHKAMERLLQSKINKVDVEDTAVEIHDLY